MESNTQQFLLKQKWPEEHRSGYYSVRGYLKVKDNYLYQLKIWLKSYLRPSETSIQTQLGNLLLFSFAVHIQVQLSNSLPTAAL